MDTKISQHEQISALLDGELTDTQSEVALNLLLSKHDDSMAAKHAWDVYHQIGDVLRSDDLDVNLSADFSQRFSLLLEAEPVILAPRILSEDPPKVAVSPQSEALAMRNFSRTWAWGGMAAAAVFTVVLLPRLTSIWGGNTEPANQLAINVPAQNVASDVQLVSSAPVVSRGARQSNEQLEMLRDPRLDSYLQAHQKFSPSMAGGSQFVSQVSNSSESPMTNSVEKK